MEKIITILLTVIVVFMSMTDVVYASYETTESSSALSGDIVDDTNYEEMRLRSFLESYNSPISEEADTFVQSAQDYDLDWRLLVSISGVESTFGKHIPTNSYNAYGWAGGRYAFESWEDSIDHVSEALRTKYIDKGAESVHLIGRTYAPPSTTWAYKVEGFMYKIDPFPMEFSL